MRQSCRFYQTLLPERSGAFRATPLFRRRIGGFFQNFLVHAAPHDPLKQGVPRYSA